MNRLAPFIWNAGAARNVFAKAADAIRGVGTTDGQEASMRAWLLLLWCVTGCSSSSFGEAELTVEAGAEGGEAVSGGAAGSGMAGASAVAGSGAGGTGWAGGAGVAAGAAGDVAGAAGVPAEAGVDGVVEAGDEPVVCPPDQHACNGTCVASTPEKGCGVQCSPCTGPDWSLPTCAPTGECDFVCMPGCVRIGSGCSCPDGQGCCVDADCETGYACFDGRCRTAYVAECVTSVCEDFCSLCKPPTGTHIGSCHPGYPDGAYCLCSS